MLQGSVELNDWEGKTRVVLHRLFSAINKTMANLRGQTARTLPILLTGQQHHALLIGFTIMSWCDVCTLFVKHYSYLRCVHCVSDLFWVALQQMRKLKSREVDRKVAYVGKQLTSSLHYNWPYIWEVRWSPIHKTIWRKMYMCPTSVHINNWTGMVFMLNWTAFHDRHKPPDGDKWLPFPSLQKSNQVWHVSACWCSRDIGSQKIQQILICIHNWYTLTPTFGEKMHFLIVRCNNYCQ